MLSADCQDADSSMDLNNTELMERLQEVLHDTLAAYSKRTDRGHGHGAGKSRYSASSGVTEEQIRHRRSKGLCFHCGSSGHIKRDCPKLDTGESSDDDGPSNSKGPGARGQIQLSHISTVQSQPTGASRGDGKLRAAAAAQWGSDDDDD